MRIGAVILLLVFAGSARATESVAPLEKHADADSPTKLYMAPYFSVPILTIAIEPPAHAKGDAPSIEYQPDVRPDVGLEFDYGPLSLALSAPIPSKDDGEDDKKAKPSKYWDSKFGYTSGMWALEFGAHRYQGFAMTSSADAAKTTDQRDSEPDLVKRGRYANVLFFPFGENLELDKRVDENTHHGFHWSPVLEASYDHNELSSASSIVPKAFGDAYGRDASTTAVRIDAYSASTGAAAKYSTKSGQAMFAMTFGRSLDYQTLSINMEEKVARRRMGERMSMRCGADYMIDRWDYGMSLMLDKATSPLNEGSVSTSLGGIIISAGTELTGV